MQLSFKEIYYKDGTKTPLLEIEYNANDKLNDITYNLDFNDSLYIDLNHNCLNNYNVMEIVNKIFNTFKVDYIDKYIWEEFIECEREQHNNNGGTKKYYKCPIPYISLNDNNFNQLYSYKTKVLKDLNTETIQNVYKNCHKVINYEVKFYNEEEYCYYLLEILFNLSFNFKIKKCKQCNKPFITHNQNFQTCTRIFKNNITCNKYYEKIRKQHQYDDPIKHLIKNVRDKLKNDYDKLDYFNQMLTTKKEEYLNDNKAFINWILDNYYFTDNGRKDVIERLNLSKYL